MAELTPRERLQPSLLDRLTDRRPHEAVESRDERVLSMARLRECVIRDLEWLLNAENMASQQRMEDCSDAMNSVINYGVPSLIGEQSSGRSRDRLAQQIQEAIYMFEPRLIRESISVTPMSDSGDSDHHALRFEIEADLWAQPLPLHLYFQTEIDLISGDIEVTGRRA